MRNCLPAHDFKFPIRCHARNAGPVKKLKISASLKSNSRNNRRMIDSRPVMINGLLWSWKEHKWSRTKPHVDMYIFMEYRNTNGVPCAATKLQSNSTVTWSLHAAPSNQALAPSASNCRTPSYTTEYKSSNSTILELPAFGVEY